MSNKFTSFQALSQKYKNFLVPALKIKVKGQDVISNLNIAIEDMSVVHSLETAGSCNFNIVNAYDIKKRQFDSNITDKFRLGVVIQVELGYSSALEVVFKGYISEVNYNFSEVPMLEVTAMDVRKLMMEAMERRKKFYVKTYSAAFSELMQDYKKICTHLVIDKTTTQLGTDGISQNASDFEFIKEELAPIAGREFFVVAGKAFFRIPKKLTVPITALTWGSSLISFNKSSNYLNAEVIVLGFDEDKQKRFEGTAIAVTKAPQIPVTVKKQPIILPDPDATDQKKAEQRAKSEAEKLIQQAESANGICIGLPELVPGRFIRLEKMGNDVSKKYYITKVTHRLGTEGFETEFETGGWE